MVALGVQASPNAVRIGSASEAPPFANRSHTANPIPPVAFVIIVLLLVRLMTSSPVELELNVASRTGPRMLHGQDGRWPRWP